MSSKYDGELKLELLTLGVELDSAAQTRIGDLKKLPVVARTGVASGLEFILFEGNWINACVVPKSKFRITCEGGAFRLYAGGTLICSVSIPSCPSWHDKVSARGIPFSSVGQLRGDRLGITLYKDCIYFYSGEQCAFCAINYNPSKEVQLKDHLDVAELVNVATRDPVMPAKHIYFNLGNTSHPERGLDTYPDLMSSIRIENAMPIHLNQTVPRNAAYLSYLKDIGFTEVSFNIEVYDEDAAKRIIPGKYRELGRAHQLTMLEKAVGIFGFGNVSSCLVVGLETLATTVEGVRELMRRGVIPKLSIFRPLRGSRLRNFAPPSINFLKEVRTEARALSDRYGVALGPTCNPCKMLSLT